MVVLDGSLLGAAENMLQKGIYPTIAAELFLKVSIKAVKHLTEMSTPVDLSDKASLLRAASTSLNSKVLIYSMPQGFGLLCPNGSSRNTHQHHLLSLLLLSCDW